MQVSVKGLDLIQRIVDIFSFQGHSHTDYRKFSGQSI